MRLPLPLRLSAALLLFLGSATSLYAQPPSYQLQAIGMYDRGCAQPQYKDFNQAGQMLVGFLSPDGRNTHYAALLNKDGGQVTGLSLYGLQSSTWALILNESSQVAGLGATPSGKLHPFFWSNETGIVDITPDAPDSAQVSLCAMNDHGDVVGSVDLNPFIYTGGRRYDLNTEVTVNGKTTDRTRFETAGAINNAGEILVWGQTGDGQLHQFLLTPTNASGNLLVRAGFEEYTSGGLGAPGWISDSIRQIPAKSETNQPHSGSQNGACWATTAQDCGMYQEITAPVTGHYIFTIFANADRFGGLVGANVNGAAAASTPIGVRGFRNYGDMYTVSFNAVAGDRIRVWMYSPASPGYVVIDDASLTTGSTAP